MSDRKHKSVNSRTATSEQYIASSIIRFGRLSGYIEEKLMIDKFAIQGNLMMAEGLREYARKNLETLRCKKKIRILDVGPAIGAVSSMLALQVLDEFGLLEKAQVHLLDVSSNVIQETQLCNFFYPESILRPELKSKILRKLRQSKAEITSVEHIPWKDGNFTIIIACFLFHHLHDNLKPHAAAEMIRTLEQNGFLGIAEEWFKDYDAYAASHEEDKIPLAFESIVSYKRLTKMIPDLEIFFSHDKQNKTNSYTFCGVKKTNAPIQ